jgi:hypothetical protein
MVAPTWEETLYRLLDEGETKDDATAWMMDNVAARGACWMGQDREPDDFTVYGRAS